MAPIVSVRVAPVPVIVSVRKTFWWAVEVRCAVEVVSTPEPDPRPEDLDIPD